MLKMGASIGALLIAGKGYAQNEPSIEVEVGSAPFGKWHGFCDVPALYYIKGVRIRIEGNRGSGDDTALNGLQLMCAQWGDWAPSPEKLYRASVHDGFWGDWQSDRLLPDGCYLIGMKLRIEAPQGDGDDTGLNGIELIYRHQQGAGVAKMVAENGYWGDWGEEHSAPGGYYVSGVAAKMEDRVSGGDDTAMDGIKLRYSLIPPQFR